MCGPAEAGKTTLVRRLGATTAWQRFRMKSPTLDERTLGVDVIPLTLDKDCHFSVWDFAGERQKAERRPGFFFYHILTS